LVFHDMDFDDWRFGPLLMAVREPFKTIDLGWVSDRTRFEGQYNAMRPPYAFSSHPKGNLRVDRRDYPLKDFMIRDHSWGLRIWGLNQHYECFHATNANVA